MAGRAWFVCRCCRALGGWVEERSRTSAGSGCADARRLAAWLRLDVLQLFRLGLTLRVRERESKSTKRRSASPTVRLCIQFTYCNPHTRCAYIMCASASLLYTLLCSWFPGKRVVREWYCTGTTPTYRTVYVCNIKKVCLRDFSFERNVVYW